MTDTGAHCMHASCTCLALNGDYCSDYCRDSAGSGDIICACGHKECVGSDDAEIEATA